MGCMFSSEVGVPHKGVGLKEPNGCRDIGFLAFFVLFWVGMFIITGYAVDQGDVHRLIYPTDSYGFLCGRNNEFKGVKFDLSDRPNLYYLNSLQLHDPRNWKYAKTICVKDCPTAQDRCQLNKLPCLSNNQYRCPYYRAAENNVFGSLNFTTDDPAALIRNTNPLNAEEFRTFFWTNTTYFSLLAASNQTKCNITLTNTNTFNQTLLEKFKLVSGQGQPCGPYYQFSSQYNFGPCYPVWESTVEYCRRCYPDSSFFQVGRSAVSVTLDGALVGPFPPSQQDNTIKHRNQRISAKVQQYVADLQRSWWLVLLTGLVAGLVLSGTFLVLVVYFPSMMVFVILLISILGSVGFTLWCFQLAGDLFKGERYVGKSQDKRLPNSLDPSALDRHIWFWIGIAMIVFTVVYTIVCGIFAAGLAKVTTAIKSAALAITDIATLFFFPLLPFLLEAGLVAYWVVVTYLIFSSGKRKANYRDPVLYKPLSVRELYKNTCPPIPGYEVYINKDTVDPGVYSAPQSLDVYTLARACQREAELCKGFNTLGYFKQQRPPFEEWIDKQDVCLYWKSTNWTMPPPISLLSPPPMYPIVAPSDLYDANGNLIKPQPKTIDDCVTDPNCYISYAWNISLRWSFIYFLFGLVFTHHVIVGLTFLTAAGAVAYWYWRNDNMPVHPTIKSLFKSICYCLGSICFYAFLYTLLLPIYLPAKMLQRVFCNPTRNSSAKWVTCCCDPFIALLDRLTLCMIGIKGKPYIEAARRSFVILAQAGGEMVATIDTTIDFLVVACKVAVAVLCGVLTFFITGLPRFSDKNKYEETYVCNPLFTVFLATGFAYAVADLYFAILEAAVGVVFLSLAEDQLAHSGRPVNAPPELAQLLGLLVPPPKPPPPSVSSSSSSSKKTVPKPPTPPPPQPSEKSSKSSCKSSSKSSVKPPPQPPAPSVKSSKSSTTSATSGDHIKWIPPSQPGTMPTAPKPLAPLRPLPATVMANVAHTYSPLNVSPPVPPPGYYTSYNASYPNRYHPIATQPLAAGPINATITGTISGNFQGTLNTE